MKDFDFKVGDVVRHKESGQEMEIDEIEESVNVNTNESHPNGYVKCSWTVWDEKEYGSGERKNNRFCYTVLELIKRRKNKI
jgi:uncharacterized protein YodC (DUF2158 family)